MDGDRITLRSYRLAFQLERRLHRIDRFRIPVPYGVPLVGLAYGAAAAVGVVVLSGLPVAGELADRLPWPMRLILVPALVAHLLCRTRDDGRPTHDALVARLLFLVRARHYVGLEPVRHTRLQHLADVTFASDERCPFYRKGRVLGPAHVLLRQPARAAVRGQTVELQQLEDRPMLTARQLVLGDGQELRLR